MRLTSHGGKLITLPLTTLCIRIILTILSTEVPILYFDGINPYDSVLSRNFAQIFTHLKKLYQLFI